MLSFANVNLPVFRQVEDCTDIDCWLQVAGWEPELIPDAKSVSQCESHWHPDSTNGESLGLFQLWSGWFDYYHIDPTQWADPIVNAHLARLVYQYDIDHGWDGWEQWQCKPTALTTGA